MVALTYWVSECLDDAKAYSIRTKTKREALAERALRHDPHNYGDPVKVSVQYRDGFDLATQCLEEGGGWWEAPLPPPFKVT